MKLYVHPASPFARKTVMAASLLGIAAETVFVDLFAGQGQAPEFLKLNPQGKVPTLEDGGFTLWESNAIVQYLGSVAGDSPLYPNDAKVRADIARWMFWESTTWAPAGMVYVYENVLKAMLNRGEPDPEELRKGEEKFHRAAKLLDDHLAGRDWLVGDGLSLADISVAASLMYAVPGKYPLETYPNITRWFAQIETLPAWIATIPPAA